MLFQPGESFALMDRAEYLTKGRRQGTLFLTNQRLVFEVHQSGGLLKGSKEVTLFEVGLQDILNAHVSKPLIKLPLLGQEVLRIQTRAGNVEFSLAQPEAWRNGIANLKRAPAPMALPAVMYVPMAPPAAAQPTQVVQQTIERQVVKVRCLYCGAVADETANNCPSCGVRM